MASECAARGSGVSGTNTLKVSFDKSGNASFQSEGHVVSTLTNVANGKVVHVDSAGRDAFSDAGVVHPDGTITFTGTLTGRDVRIYTSHRNVFLKDAGFLAILDTVDPQGNFLSRELVAHGREHTHARAWSLIESAWLATRSSSAPIRTSAVPDGSACISSPPAGTPSRWR